MLRRSPSPYRFALLAALGVSSCKPAITQAPANTEQAGTEQAGTEQAGTEQAGTEQAGTEHAGTEQAGTEHAGTEQAAPAAVPLGAWPPSLAELAERTRDRFAAPTVTVAGAAALDDPIVVDVRTPPEIAVSRLEGSRPLPTEEDREAFLSEHPARPVLVYCTAGWRSAEYTQVLRDHGIEAFNLEGGICSWVLHGKQIVDAAGGPATRIHAFSADFADCVPAGYEAVTGVEDPPR
jgi:rhodanese-related sulfurtransferase